MLFSSQIFIFIFLPVVLAIYYIVLKKRRFLQNLFLFIASLFFYAWGEPKFVLIMILSIIFNWLFGLLIEKYSEKPVQKKLIAFFSIGYNIFVIFIFKYLMFSLSNINQIFDSNIKIPEIILPIGISFFTFQAISYVLDIYRKKAKAQKNILNVGLYISFFPQLIAGPIVRYETIEKQIKERKETFDDFAVGVTRFIIGLGKKVLIANNMAIVADQAFNSGELSVTMAWLGAFAYTLQIFFDFSGYSDMAIGLGRMFGFHFLENFNYPYISKSATEFWRRWHISLGTWFRDYVYIPLGGSRMGKKRNIINLFIVWSLTGIWHGANWTFLIWGLLYFVLLTFEKYFDINKLNKKFDIPRHLYTMFFVIIGWVVFRAENVYQAVKYIKNMFGLNYNVFIDNAFVEYITEFYFYFLVGIIFSYPTKKIVHKIIDTDKPFVQTAYVVTLLLIFFVTVSFLVKGSYNPFIYFNF